MDDLAGLDWSAPTTRPTSTQNNPTSFPPLRQTPTPQFSGRSTPLSAQQSGSAAANRPLKASSKPATPANDRFASLLGSNTSKPAKSNLSLQERQRQIQEEKLKQEAERQRQYGGVDSQFWDNLGSGKSTPEPASSGIQRPATTSFGQAHLKPFAGLDTSTKRPMASPPADDDILSAFNSSAPVDSSSHFPPPSSSSYGQGTLSNGKLRSTGPVPVPDASSTTLFDDDDDMFGLKQFAGNQPSAAQPATSMTEGGDDILGLLGKPVSEFQARREPVPEVSKTTTDDSPDLENPQAKAVAELVDMGFPADKAANALATTESGLDVQAAVGYLLNQAHAQAKQQSRDHSEDRPRRSPDDFDEQPRRPNTKAHSGSTRSDASTPAWMREEGGRSRSAQRKQDGQSATQEKDVTQIASEIGSTLFKSANSLWKTGRKQVQKAVADFQQDGDPSVPKWMRSASPAENVERPSQSSRPRRDNPRGAAENVTDEAMMLESGGRPPHRPETSDRRPTSDTRSSRQRQELEDPRFAQRPSSRSPAPPQPDPRLDKHPAARLTRQQLEEQTEQVYISPARRKKTTPQPDLFSQEQAAPSRSTPHQVPPSQSNNPFLKATSAPKPQISRATPPIPSKPKAPPRQIPPASASALSTSAGFRQKGTEAFKRGDYSAAHAAYSSALAPLPNTHPITIIVLCNRAVTNIKVGDPKAAVSDADAALAIIGVSKGEGEKIDLGGTEGQKDMKEFYGKALMRKAEALEHMEKWADAGKVWRAAVEAGVGGSVSIQGRNRCDKAAGGGDKAVTPAAAKRLPVRKPPPPKASALSDLGGGPAADSAAVKRLKEANAAAEKADDEKFALTDQVDAKLIAWKGTKADNLRALLGSLDKVLWPEAGWNKVNMGDLVIPNKVKIVYMKAIAKVHPDKISQTATTEQRMLSAAVFATLNEAWDKFKAENGM